VNFSCLGRRKLVEQGSTGPHRPCQEELAEWRHTVDWFWHTTNIMRHLPLLTAERGSDRTGCALLRRSTGVWSAPLSPRNETLDSENAPHHTRLAKDKELNSFFGERDRRGTVTLPARFVDQSLLLLARLLVHDSSGNRHRVRFETKNRAG